MPSILEKMPRSKKGLATAPVRIDEDLAQMARVIAAGLDISMPDWLSDQLRPVIEREYPKVLQMLAKKQQSRRERE